MLHIIHYIILQIYYIACECITKLNFKKITVLQQRNSFEKHMTEVAT